MQEKNSFLDSGSMQIKTEMNFPSDGKNFGIFMKTHEAN